MSLLETDLKRAEVLCVMNLTKPTKKEAMKEVARQCVTVHTRPCNEKENDVSDLLDGRQANVKKLLKRVH